MNDDAPLLDQLLGRARFCEDRGEVKTPELLRLAAEEIGKLRSILDAKLPCDVAVAPATIVRKGCPLSVVVVSLEQRVKWGVDVGDIADAAKRQIDLGPSTNVPGQDVCELKR